MDTTQTLQINDAIFISLILLISIWTLRSIVTRILKQRIIMKHGYPPEHCDVFGNDSKRVYPTFSYTRIINNAKNEE